MLANSHMVTMVSVIVPNTVVKQEMRKTLLRKG